MSHRKQLPFVSDTLSRYPSKFTMTWPRPIDRADFRSQSCLEPEYHSLCCDSAPFCPRNGCDNLFACLSLSDFKSNFRAAPIRSVDVYNVMCNVTGIAPLPNNGSWSRVLCMLKGQASSAPSVRLSSCVLVSILLLLFV